MQIHEKPIKKDDFVIIGGGGILNASGKWNRQIQIAFEKTKNVIIWGSGFNSSKLNIGFQPLNLEKALLIGIRDFKHPYFNFVPCVTCKSKFFDCEYTLKRKIGIVKHHTNRLQLDSSLKGIETIENNLWIRDVITFIGESEYILSNSYHALYWATLLNKKVGRLNNGYNSRFRDCMYNYPIVTTLDQIDRCKQLQLTADDLSFFRKLNDVFWLQVKEKILEFQP